MEEKKEPKENKRREFLKTLGIIGAAGASGAMALYFGQQYEKIKSGKKVRLLTVDNKVVEFENGELKEFKGTTEDFIARGREGLPGKSWVMVIDLAKCRNARKCISACQNAHHLKPEQYHINTLQMQDSEMASPYFMPKPCQHCDNPPCVSVCPVDATFKRTDGPVLIDNERCIGCRFCIAACPYSARIFNWFDPKDAEKFANDPYDIELNVPQKRGTVSKCLFSADRLRINELPYCVSNCPNGVYYFGDKNEDAVTNGTTKETVRLSTLLKDNAAYRLMEELGQEPRVYYLPPKDRLFPFPEEENKNNHV
ncbi:MAG: 4Fe-4S dicluster domain-containing protein [Bacteroidia bacterium]|nr:4Fe-4S dicluster domain-containing protein [Bacteroidia bacterium]